MSPPTTLIYTLPLHDALPIFVELAVRNFANRPWAQPNGILLGDTPKCTYQLGVQRHSPISFGVVSLSFREVFCPVQMQFGVHQYVCVWISCQGVCDVAFKGVYRIVVKNWLALCQRYVETHNVNVLSHSHRIFNTLILNNIRQITALSQWRHLTG